VHLPLAHARRKRYLRNLGELMKIAENIVVSIHYELTNIAGEVLDSSLDKDPLTYLHGTGGLIPGLEKALDGHVVGDEMDVEIVPEDAYGPVIEDLIQSVPRSAFEGVDKIEPGMSFEATGNEGEEQRVTVVAVSEETVTIDANHPLAGETLHFNVSIKALRAPTEEELSHGHAH
jgi:FKBP-type peptidyl-prolyl cis-trans isomerase SlyD